MQAEQIAKTLGNAKRVNGQWLASCPVPGHGRGNGDKNPSLSISDGEDGRPLFHCHGGCDQHTVFATMRERNLLPELEQRPEPLSLIKPMVSSRQLEKEWHYTDEEGVVLYIKQRYKTTDAKGKDYKLIKVDEAGRRHASMGDARIVPYRLPELLDAISKGRYVYLTEGEKAADAIISLGSVATTSHAGSGSWPEAITQYFAGANVVILPDNDAPGWKYAKKAAAKILPVAKSVRVIDLGGDDLGDDAHEWIHLQGKTRQDLADLVKAQAPITTEQEIRTPERLKEKPQEAAASLSPASSSTPVALHATPAPDAEQKAQRRTLTLEAWDEIRDEPVEWLIDRVIPKQGFVALYGPPGSFKSFIALDIAASIARHAEWFGQAARPSEQGAVIYIAGEGHGGIGARIKACRIHHQIETGIPIYFLRHQVNLRSSMEDISSLTFAINDLVAAINCKVDLIVIDTLARAFGGGNENSSEDMGAFITSCGQLQEHFRAALLVIHHSGKDAAKGLRGHSSLLGAVDTELELVRFEDQPKGVLTVSKQKDGEDGLRFGFEMVEIDIEDEDKPSLSLDETRKSLAVQPSDEALQSRMSEAKKEALNRHGKGRNQAIAVDALVEAINTKGTHWKVSVGTRKCVKLAQWKATFAQKMGTDEEGDEAFRSAWRRVRGDKGRPLNVRIENDWAWIEEPAKVDEQAF
jgi:DNA replication protein DnaC